MKLCLFLTFVIVTLKGICQKSVELTAFSRYDNHAQYLSRYFERSYINYITLAGISHGINLSYLQPAFPHLKVKGGIGYYRVGVEDITSTTPWGRPNTRAIDYRHPLGIQPGFSSDKYYYNSLNVLFGFQYETPLKNRFLVISGLDFDWRYSFSQRYHMSWGEGLVFKSRKGRSVGFGVNTYLGIKMPVHNKQLYLTPEIIIPIFQRMKGDVNFGEDEKMKIDNALTGVGIALTIGRYL